MNKTSSYVKWGPKHTAALKEYLLAGLTDYEIAAKMNVSYNVIRKRRQKFKWRSNKPKHGDFYEKPVRSARDRPDPLLMAQNHLPGFNRVDMTIHGKPATLNDIVRATNRILKNMGIEQIASNPEWLV